MYEARPAHVLFQTRSLGPAVAGTCGRFAAASVGARAKGRMMPGSGGRTSESLHGARSRQRSRSGLNVQNGITCAIASSGGRGLACAALVSLGQTADVGRNELSRTMRAQKTRVILHAIMRAGGSQDGGRPGDTSTCAGDWLADPETGTYMMMKLLMVGRCTPYAYMRVRSWSGRISLDWCMRGPIRFRPCACTCASVPVALGRLAASGSIRVVQSTVCGPTAAKHQ